MNVEAFARVELTKLLIEMGLPANLQGFRCLRQCALEVINDPSLIKGVTKVLYPKVGTILKIDPAVVERGMRHATDIGFYKTKFKPLCKVFDIESDGFGYKPTSSELIALLADYINNEVTKREIDDDNDNKPKDEDDTPKYPLN